MRNYPRSPPSHGPRRGAARPCPRDLSLAGGTIGQLESFFYQQPTTLFGFPTAKRLRFMYSVLDVRVFSSPFHDSIPSRGPRTRWMGSQNFDTSAMITRAHTHTPQPVNTAPHDQNCESDTSIYKPRQVMKILKQLSSQGADHFVSPELILNAQILFQFA